jgi:hypothetical protein
MKNIHILPTDKPSRLHEYDFLSPMGLSKEPLQWRLGRNIYITNNEEIKEGDWCLSLGVEGGDLLFKAKDIKYHKTCKKIILTTDQDLQKDGVQAIDDEFLEWFVKNQSCEEVKTIKIPYFDESGYSYLLIIPKEETKQDEIDFISKELNIEKEKSLKQETLEEAAERLVKETTLYGSQESSIGSSARSYFETELRCVLLGMQWQQEQIGKSEFLQKLRATLSDAEARRLIFEQFKKK